MLDIGCGRGELTNRFFELGANAIGVDYSRDAINIAQTTFVENERLKYLCEDVLQFPEDEKFDRIIMADVVEHIEKFSLDRLLKKIPALLSDKGYLIIHTVPNKLYYDIYYADYVKELRNRYVYMPANPRSYYEKLMHINEQTPATLKEALEQHFRNVTVWISSGTYKFLEWFGKDCPNHVVCSHSDIFAIAACSEDFNVEIESESTDSSHAIIPNRLIEWQKARIDF